MIDNTAVPGILSPWAQDSMENKIPQATTKAGGEGGGPGHLPLLQAFHFRAPLPPSPNQP